MRRKRTWREEKYEKNKEEEDVKNEEEDYEEKDEEKKLLKKGRQAYTSKGRNESKIFQTQTFPCLNNIFI